MSLTTPPPSPPLFDVLLTAYFQLLVPPLPIILIAMNILGETDKADGPTSCGVLLITSGIEQGLMIILGSI